MANATKKVDKGTVGVLEAQYAFRSVETLSAATIFYPGAMMGTDLSGYLCKGDDTQGWLFAGIIRGTYGEQELPAGTAGDEALRINIEKPTFIVMDLTSVAVTDIGKPVYATFDQTLTLDYSATTYANLVGHVEDKLATSIAVIRCAYDGLAAHVRLGAAKRMAATGAQSLNKYDIGKTIFIANTATLALTLPAIADIPAGSHLTICKDHASDANAITVTGNASENINGANTFTSLDAAWDSVTLTSNGARWVTTSKSIA